MLIHRYWAAAAAFLLLSQQIQASDTPPPRVTRAITNPGAPNSTDKEVAQWHDLIVQRCQAIDYRDARGKRMDKRAFLQAMTRGIPGLTMTEYGATGCSRMSLRLLTAAEAANGTQAPARAASTAP